MQHAAHHIHELQTLYEISQMLVVGSQQQQLLSEILEVLDKSLGMKTGMVTLLSSDGNEIQIEVAHNISEGQSSKVRYRVGDGITGKVMQTGKSVCVAKVSEEPQFLNRFERWSPDSGEISFICVPISIGTQVIGTISAYRIFDESARLEDDQRVLSIVASMIANDVRARREAVLQRQRLENENQRLRCELEDRFRPENIIGNSNEMGDVYSHIHQVAASDTTVLIRGESGTGKELVAHAIHYSSPRSKGPFVKVNCASLNENILESELFGHAKGAFTGAVQDRSGRFEEANGGTLFLDEIGDFSATTQVKLLRVLQEGEFERVGSSETQKTNARIIVATNRDLEQAIGSQSFRQDLYYRINVFPIFLPPLRERKGDILQLADYFVEQYSQKMDKDVRRISTPAINMMMVYHWPGNVRELENCIERAVLLSSDGVIHGHNLPPTLQTPDSTGTVGTGSLKERLNLFERDLVVDALKRCRGNIAATARDLNTTTRILGYKIKEQSIDPVHYKRNRK
ncbi:MAG: nif-specific transcriptional activator NifA [Phycisphaerae bacterium]|nr:nif-specific transcriptional activator NifA [Phycisphaerae bacterium]